MRIKRWLLVVFVLLLPMVVLAQVTHRPVEDFTSAQATVMGWLAGDSPFGASTDLGGVVNRYLATHSNCAQPTLNTSFSGDITEKALPDGRTQVHVILHGKNAFMRAYLVEDGTPVLGHSRAQVCAGAAPAVGDFVMVLDFIHNRPPGGALPDLFFFGAEPGQELKGLLVNATATGPLNSHPDVADGTMGVLHVVQRLINVNGNGIPGKDNWPAEIINLTPIGQ